MEAGRSRGTREIEHMMNRELVEFVGARVPAYRWLGGLVSGGEHPDRDGSMEGDPSPV